MRTLKAETGGFKASLAGLLVETWHQKKKEKKRKGKERTRDNLFKNM